jgi:hypothetical protein
MKSIAILIIVLLFNPTPDEDATTAQLCFKAGSESCPKPVYANGTVENDPKECADIECEKVNINEKIIDAPPQWEWRCVGQIGIYNVREKFPKAVQASKANGGTGVGTTSPTGGCIETTDVTDPHPVPPLRSTVYFCTTPQQTGEKTTRTATSPGSETCPDDQPPPPKKPLDPDPETDQ